MLLMTITAVYYDNQVKHINRLCGHNAEFWILKQVAHSHKFSSKSYIYRKSFLKTYLLTKICGHCIGDNVYSLLI
jgi:hypothetical protein